MLTQFFRALKRTDNALVDVSLDNMEQIGIRLNSDYLYLAQHYPFVNLFFLFDTFNAAFVTTPAVTITTPYNVVGPVWEIQHIVFTPTPIQGGFALDYGAESTSLLPHDASAAQIQTALRLLTGLQDVLVTGSMATGLDVEFVNVPAPSTLVVDAALLQINGLSKFKIEYWADSQWRDAVDIIDGTRGLKQHGQIQFTPDSLYSWNEITETRTDSSNAPEELRGLNISDCYWIRISFINDATYDLPNVTTKLKRLAYAFTTTNYVNTIDCEGPSYYEGIKTGKTDWIDEIIYASEEMVSDMKAQGFIKSAGQIIELGDVYLPAAFNTLKHIYFQLGTAYRDRRAIMDNKYHKALGSRALTVDTNMDGKLERKEFNSTESRMVR